MPLGIITPRFQHNQRLWTEGEIISGNQLRFIAPVPPIYSGSVWEQDNPSLNDNIQFSNLNLNSGAFELIWLVAESPNASNDVEIRVNDIIWGINIDLTSPIVAMREIRITGNVLLTPNITVNFINRANGGFIASPYFIIKQIP